MNKMSLVKLNRQLGQLGFGDSHLTALKNLADHNGPSFDYKIWDHSDREGVSVNLHVINFDVRYYDVTMKSLTPIPEVVIGGIDVKGLDEKMQSVNWNHDTCAEALEAYWVKRPARPHHQEVSETIQQLFELQGHSIEGQDVANRLMAKHWLDTKLADNFPNKLDHLRNRVTIDTKYNITLQEAKAVLRGEPLVKTIEISGKPTKFNVGLTPEGTLFMKASQVPKKVLDQGLSI